MFDQEDYNESIVDADRATLNYITKNNDKTGHEGCVYLKIEDCSDIAMDWFKNKFSQSSHGKCFVEVYVPPEYIKEVKEIMLKLIEYEQERGW